ncbi:MAG: M23 family metallopeptidase [Pseudonocardia sp.]|nr:M23 family metallopeptidase [Pseudonocardia sp.]
MARHRSPSGRRAHLGPPLSVALATAGVGGAVGARSHAASGFPADTSAADLASSVPLRIVAAVVAGGALAAAGQQALDSSLPAVLDGAGRLIGTSAATTWDVPAEAAQVAPIAVAAGLPSALRPVAAEPEIADVADLIKAADLDLAAQQAAKAAAEQAAAEQAAAEQAAAPAVAIGGGVQMIVGRITSGFGGRWGSVHQGLDIAAPIGTPVRVPLDGTVISSGPVSGFGLWVRVQHADGTITVYGHINRSLVKVGQQVQAGDVIAETGNRGQSTGPHLHIGVMQNGHYINPRPWLDAHGVGY